MIDYSPIHGNAYANDPQYDRMTGRVTYRHEVVGMTLDGWKVRHTVEYIDLGRAAALATHDPNAVGAYEGPGAIGVQGYAHHKTRALLEQVRALLAVRPMLCHELATATGATTRQIQKLFTNQPAGFRVVGRGTRGFLWGLDR